MVVKSQDNIEYDIYEFILEKACIFCKDKKDKRKKHLLGTYTRERAADIFLKLINMSEEYYEMPKK